MEGDEKKVEENIEEKSIDNQSTEIKKTEETKSIEETRTTEVVHHRKQALKDKFALWFKNPYDKVFLIILIIAFIIRFYLYIRTINQPIWWDTGAYLATAKKWSIAPQISDPWYYRRGFFWPLFCSFFYMTGLGEPGIRFFELLFSMGIIIVSYLLIKDMFNRKLALLTALGLTFSWVILFFTVRPLTYVPGPFFILTSLYFFWKGYVQKKGNKFLYISAVFFGLGVFTRMQNLMFVPVFLIFIIVKDKFKFLKNKSLWISLLIIILVVSPVFILYTRQYENPISDIFSYYFGIGNTGTVATEKHISTIGAYFKDLPYELTGVTPNSFFSAIIQPLVLLFIIGFIFLFADLFLGIDKIFKNKELQKKLLVFLWVVLFYFITGYLAAKEIFQGYMIPAFPFLFFIISFGLLSLGDIASKKFKINSKAIFVIVFIIFIGILIPNLIWGFQLIEAKRASYGEIQAAGIWIKERSNPEDIVITQSFSQIGYYSERKTYAPNSRPHGDIVDTRDVRNESEFHQWALENKPRYMVLSLIQKSEEWVYNYPLKYNETWKPVQAWFADNEQTQPILIIYESDYLSSGSFDIEDFNIEV